MEQKVKIFTELSKIDCSKAIEKKNGLSYLSWAHAINKIEMFCEEHGLDLEYDNDGYTYDEKLGYMVNTHVTINGKRKNMWLHVMDARNFSMKDHPYKAKLGKYTYDVEPASMSDINKTFMRCLVKNFGIWGLGWNIYAGCDLPDEIQKETEPVKAKPQTQKPQTSAPNPITPAQYKELENRFGVVAMSQYCKQHGYEKKSQITYDEYLALKNSNEINTTN